MSRFPAWYFRPMDAGEVHVDPVHDEFFKMQDLADALVREAVQNSLDARRHGRTVVRVRFRFGTGVAALSPEGARQYFGGLREHLDASSILSVLPREDEAVPYLLIEDFGTRGLTGDPAIDPELESDGEAKNDFFYFWRNVGRSNKSEVDRGRWGLGKAVFSVASRIRTIFGLTRRADDSRSLLLGQSVLKTHILDGTRHYPYGFFAEFEKRNSLPLPIEDPLLLERFADDFGLYRSEPGLSVVVPYFRADELSMESVVGSAVRQYFYPIIRNDLVIEVEDGSRKESISSKTLEDVAARYVTEENVGRLARLARWSLGNEERVTLRDGSGERAPKWSEDAFDENTLLDLRDRFERGQPVAIRAPLLVKRKKARTPAASYFDVVLEKDESLRKPELHFIRRGITIPDVKSPAASDKAVRGLVIIDHDALSTFLGDAENPAHSDWSERADKLRLLYDHHATTLRFVKSSAAFIASLLSRPPAGRVRDFLMDIFSVDMVDEEQQSTARIPIRDPKGDESSESPPSTPAHLPRISISRVANGFTVRGSGDAAVVARQFTMELAYRARNGNPFRKHSAFDFDLTTSRGAQQRARSSGSPTEDTAAEAAMLRAPAASELTISAVGADLTPLASNRATFVPSDARFQITMKGFDAHRDLLVRVFQKDEDDAAQAELH